MRIPKKENIEKTNPEDPLKRYYQPFLRYIYIKRLKIALKLLMENKNNKFDRVLEIGYGSGIFFPELSKISNKLYGLEVFGEDGKQKVINMIRKENIKADLSTGTVLKMPYPDNYFDAIVCISAIEHLNPRELSSAILEIKRVSKENAPAIIGFPSGRKIMQLYCMAVNLTWNFDFHRSDHKKILKEIQNNFKIEKKKTFFKALPIYYVLKCYK